jgi:anti-sigma factor RsiW
MQKHSDEALVAYLDGELDSTERRHVDAWLEADPTARDRLAALARATELARNAYADVLTEPLPERLIAAARGETLAAGQQEAEILVLRPNTAAAQVRVRRWHIGLAAAAGLFGIIFGGAGTYVGMGLLNRGNPEADQKLIAATTNNLWLDNAAGYYKMAVNAGGNMLVDVPADKQDVWQKISKDLSQQVRFPKLEPWGLNFRGARLIVVEGRPAAQLVYNTDNKEIGPLTLVIGASKQPDIAPSISKRQDVTLMYWRHAGRAYALVGRGDLGYLWNIAKDLAYQLDPI